MTIKKLRWKKEKFSDGSVEWVSAEIPIFKIGFSIEEKYPETGYYELFFHSDNYNTSKRIKKSNDIEFLKEYAHWYWEQLILKNVFEQ